MIEHVSYGEFFRRFDWRQGEHVTLIGPTGCGKSTLLANVLDKRGHVVFCATKPRDRDLSKLLAKKGYPIEKIWPPEYYRAKMALWPMFTKPEDMRTQRATINRALREMFTQGGWCVAVDEALYLSEQMKLGALLETYWSQGRSLNLSLAACTQRPRNLPLMAYDQATHIIVFRYRDEYVIKRLAEIGSIDKRALISTLPNLERYEFLYIYVPSGEMVISRVPADLA